jgi:DNA-binding response OmpR family regulator
MIYHLLSVGPVESLLTTRNAVLRQAGFQVETSLDLNEAFEMFRDRDFDAALLCHSIPLKDRERFVHLLKEQKPLTPVAVMTNGHASPSADLEIHNLDGPEELLRQIEDLIVSSHRRHKRQE